MTHQPGTPITLACVLFAGACAAELGDSGVGELDPLGEEVADELELFADPGPSQCTSKHEIPMLRADMLARGGGPGMTSLGQTQGLAADDEEDGGLDSSLVMSGVDQVELGVELPALANPGASVVPYGYVVADISYNWAFLFADSDGDCLLNYFEITGGTNYLDPDSDDDGWFDGPCNERRRLVLERIKAHDEQEDWGEDEFYLVADDIRYPNADTDDWWDFDDGDSRSYNRTLAARTRGTNTTGGFQYVVLEGWEDDYETWNEWTVDDLLGRRYLDLGAYEAGEKITVWYEEDDWDYEITLRVEVDHFADPEPLYNGDSDGDGISEYDEYRVARYLGGIADPYRAEVFVEVDAMSGHPLHTNAKRLVATQYFRHGINLNIWRHQTLTRDSCLTVPEARALYDNYFHRKGYNAFRYAVVGEEIWNDASGVAWRDMFIVDDSTWWIEDDVLAQAATLHHELGHTMSLRKSRDGDTGPGTYRGIDAVWHLTYHSAMNYTYQPTVVDYSGEGSGDTWDHNDWNDVDASYGLRYKFSGVSDTTTGHCGG